MTETNDNVERYGLPDSWPDKFDVIMGNPPYQEDNDEATNNKKLPLYDKFMDMAFGLGTKVMLVTPGRFLFNAGATPKAFNEERLKDIHFKVVKYYRDSKDVFNEVIIAGGIAITYRDEDRQFVPIGLFIPDKELQTIYNKIHVDGIVSLDTIWETKTAYGYSGEMKIQLVNIQTKPYAQSNAFDILPNIYLDSEIDSDMQILGRQNCKRSLKYTNSKLFRLPKSHEFYKVFVPSTGAAASDTGSMILSQPELGLPNMGHTETFISLGKFETKEEALNLMKYIKTKFVRVLVSIRKVTQHINNQNIWEPVPMQDFTSDSDIPWKLSIPEIDDFLNKKYNLSEEEIEYINTHIKEMN